MQVDDAALVDRITGRFTCGNCGEVYHDQTQPDASGRYLRHLRLDRPAAAAPMTTRTSLRQRLMEYYKKTSPLIGYYYAKGQLSTVDGLAEMDAVAPGDRKVLDKA